MLHILVEFKDLYSDQAGSKVKNNWNAEQETIPLQQTCSVMLWRDLYPVQ